VLSYDFSYAFPFVTVVGAKFLSAAVATLTAIGGRVVGLAVHVKVIGKHVRFTGKNNTRESAGRRARFSAGNVLPCALSESVDRERTPCRPSTHATSYWMDKFASVRSWNSRRSSRDCTHFNRTDASIASEHSVFLNIIEVKLLDRGYDKKTKDFSRVTTLFLEIGRVRVDPLDCPHQFFYRTRSVRARAGRSDLGFGKPSK